MKFGMRTALLLIVATLLLQTTHDRIHIGCALAHCAGKLARAAVDPIFYKQTTCELGCNALFYNDTTPMKLHYQNCTTKCALTYESPASDALLGCAMNNDCITFAPLGNATCPKPAVSPNASLADLAGEWWQAFGHNPLWDCYACQHIHSMAPVRNASWCAQTVTPDGPVAAPCWAYTYSYDLYTETGTRYFQQTWKLPSSREPGHPIAIYYTYMGSTHNETWYILASEPSRYVVLVDCSYMEAWTNVGSIVWVRPNVTLTDGEMAAIADVYQRELGWKFPEDFCADRHGPEQCGEEGGGVGGGAQSAIVV